MLKPDNPNLNGETDSLFNEKSTFITLIGKLTVHAVSEFLLTKNSFIVFVQAVKPFGKFAKFNLHFLLGP
jgi:hypothetical protein